MNRRILLIDDVRDLMAVMHQHRIVSEVNDAYAITRNFHDAIFALKYQGPWDILFLDHDLGDYEEGVERTGYDVMCFLEANPSLLPSRIILVTSNPVGRQKMQAVIDKLYRDKP